MTKEQLIKRWKARPHSWSQHSSFRDWDKEDWYQSYVMGIRKPSNKRMDFGSLVGKRIERDSNYIPMLPRGGTMEYGITVALNKDVELIGYMDQYFTETKSVEEYKTSSAKGWDQDKVDFHNQLDFYALLLKLKYKIKPEEITFNLYHMVTEEGGDFSIRFANPFTCNHYRTKRTTAQVLKLGAEIIRIRKEMETYILAHE